MHSPILINELFPDPIGPDKGWEWLEVVNISDEVIDISGWEIQVGGVRYNRAFRFPEDSKIQPQEYILVCEEYVQNCNYYTNTIAMQNGIGKTDGVRILDNSGEIINTVLYSRPNRNELKNDLGEIEKDENIIEMPAEGYSFARRDFSNTGHSIQDFFITKNPTPGKENVFSQKVIISEVGKNFIEFYTPKTPNNLNQWYFKSSVDSNERNFLENNFKSNFFFLETKKPFTQIYLYSPEGILVDSFSKKRLSENFTYCRPNSSIEEDFKYCKDTKGEQNQLKEWNPLNLLEIIQISKGHNYIIEFCVIYEYGDLFVISDNTAAVGIKCEDCQKELCFLGEIISGLEVEIIKEIEKEDIQVNNANKTNYSEQLNRVTILEGIVSSKNINVTYLETDFGFVKLNHGSYLQSKKYTIKGILNKDEEGVLNLEYPLILKEQDFVIREELEKTGEPMIIILFLLLIPFIIYKISAKLSTVNLKKYFYAKN